MSWITEANRFGRYEQTYCGFRIYWTKEPSHTTRIEIRNGEKFEVTDLYKGDLVAIDKTGAIIKDHWIDRIGEKIDMEMVQRFYHKKENRTYSKRLSKSEKRAQEYLKTNKDGK